jgi:hypothetical protein
MRQHQVAINASQLDDPAINLQQRPSAPSDWSSQLEISNPCSNQPELLHHLCSTTPQRQIRLLIQLAQHLAGSSPTDLTPCKQLHPESQGECVLAWVAAL